MKPIAIIFAKPKIQKKVVLIGAVIFLILVVIAVFYYFWQTGRIKEINFGQFLAKLTANFPQRKAEIVTSPEEGITEEKVEVPGPSQKVYEETAQPGEGITHLARRALKRYLEENGTDFNLTPEHKVYIEDYIQNRIGDRWLILGEKITISEELISEGISKARNLTTEQLENLKQYSALISSF